MAVEYVGDGRPDGVCVGQSGEKVGFFGTTPVAQQDAIADITPAADGTTAGTALNTLLAELRALGLIAS